MVCGYVQGLELGFTLRLLTGSWAFWARLSALGAIGFRISLQGSRMGLARGGLHRGVGFSRVKGFRVLGF